MNKLLSIRWKPFVISDIFTISPGKRLTKAVMKVGKRPFIGATDSNNGITAWVDNTNESLDKLVLGVNYNGSVVETFFHPYECIFSDDVKRLHLKNGITSYHVMLFLKTMIIQQKVKFEYGYKFNEKRMKRQKILLPVTDEDSPDWQFMEEYMRRKEILLLKPTIEKLCKQLILRENLGGGGKLCLHQWKPFLITEIFTEIQRGKRLKKADHTEGTVPYVSSTALNNGVDGFIGNEGSIRIFDDCITIANSGSVGSAFFHQYEFVASDHVTQLKRKGLDKYAYLFMLPIINRLSEKYCFNREINDKRIKRERILLPVNNKGEIDFEFMSSFMQEVESDMLKNTLKAFKKRLNANENK